MDNVTLQIKHRLTRYQDSALAAWRRLERQPAERMLMVGLALGFVWGIVALFGIGGVTGLVLSLVVLGGAIALVMFAQPVTDLVGPVVKPDREKPASVKVTLEGAPLNADVGNVRTEAKPSEIYPEAAPAREIQISEDIPGLLEMVELPGGTFFMGSPDADPN